MVLEIRPFACNVSLSGNMFQQHGKTKQSTLSLAPAPKRQKTDQGANTGVLAPGNAKANARSKTTREEIPDSDSDSDGLGETLDDEPTASQQTELEQSLPDIRTDKGAVEEYETMRAAEHSDPSAAQTTLSQREWVKGKSSIYVDAFYLALETVLEDEKHLFNEAEIQIFDEWRSLSYEAQYL